MRDHVREWFERRTTSIDDWRREDLLAAKSDRTVDVILPALNEANTVGGIVSRIRDTCMDVERPLVDDLVVVDSGSTDATARLAAAAGARVVQRSDVCSDVPVVPGKGEAMWRGLAATSSDIVVFIDSDLTSFTADYVVGLLGPMLLEKSVGLVKAVYDRPMVTGDIRIAAGGGRVTEIMARPLLNALFPELSGVAQPLAGEYAASRELLEGVSFPCGYGVEIALLIDAWSALGLDGLAQVDLGVRGHTHQDATRLSLMAAEVLHAAMTRADPAGAVHPPRSSGTLSGFRHDAPHVGMVTRDIQTMEREPLRNYRERRVASQ